MNLELEQLAQRAVSALVNGLYQGLLLALVLWLGLKLFRGVNAATRHLVGFVALLVVAALPVLHFLMPHPAARLASDGPLEAASTTSDGSGAVEIDGARASSPEDWALSGVTAGDDLAVNLAAGEMTWPPINLEPEGGPDSSTIGSLNPGAGPEDAAVKSWSEPLAVAAPTGSTQQPVRPDFKLPPVTHWRAEVPGLASVLVLLSLAVVAGARLLRLGWQWWVLLRLKHTAMAPDAELNGAFAALRDELQIARPVRLLVDKQITTPMAVGYFQSAVLLPAALTEETAGRGLEGILRHELAHIRRRDDWFNLLQQVIAAVHFYNPAVAWLSRRLTIDREIACDDFALARSASRRDYALLLTEFAGRNRNREWIAAPAAWSNRSQLKERINMILDPHRNTSRRLARTSAGVLTVAALTTAVVAWSAGPRLVLAASTDQPELPPAQSTPALTLTARSGEALIAHVGDAVPVPASASTDAAVAVNVGHQAGHAIVVAPRPDVAVSVRPLIKVAPHAVVTVPGRSGVIIAQATPPPPGDQGNVPRAPKAPKPGRAPKALPAPAADPAGEKPGESMEQRMERLERMIEQLVGGDRKFHFELKPGKEFEVKEFEWQGRINQPGEPHVWNIPQPGQHWPIDEAQQKAMEESMKRAEKEMEQAMKQAHRQMAQANEQVERARRDGELRAQLELKKDHGRGFKDAEIHRKALEGQRRGLEREMENLNRQLEHLEQQAERLDEQMERLDEERERLDEERERQDQEREESKDNGDSEPRPKEKNVKP